MENQRETVDAQYVEPVKKPMSIKKINAIKSLLVSTYSVIITVVYVMLGLFVAWHPWWLIFLTIPIYASLVEAILRKRPGLFSIEMVAVSVYVTLGFLLDKWHPTWVILLVIPVYRSTLSAFRKIKYIREND
ncbi:MAG: hypothetical protein ACOX56_06930 [Acholeplasmataceae bacterium]|jgi:hypothetical protein